MSDAKFNSHFRGSTDVIKTRLTQYLPDVEHLTASDSILVDLGCGRGEWLELCETKKIRAIGVDRSDSLVDDLLSRGFSAKCSTVLTYLHSLADSSLDCVTAFHLLEHFTLGDLRPLLAEVRRVLKPLGIFLAETPNSLNLTVASSTFWIDPTHVRPLHPEVIRYMLNDSGFEDIELRYLNPAASRIQITRNRHVNELLHAYFGPQDLGVKARIPS